MVNKADALGNLTSPKDEELIKKITELPDDSELTEPILAEYVKAIKPAEGPDEDSAGGG